MWLQRLTGCLLCSELSEGGGVIAVKLTAGFGIPDHLLQAPIAFDWRLIGSNMGPVSSH